MDIIQPLLDMAIAPVFPVVENGITAAGKEAQELNVDLCHYALLFRFWVNIYIYTTVQRSSIYFK